MKKLLFVSVAVLFLAGCPQRVPEPPAKVSEVKPPPVNEQEQKKQQQAQEAENQKEQQPVEVVPPPPKIVTYDWSGSITPLVESMIGHGQINTGSLLVLDNVLNKSNGTLQTASATQALYRVVSNYSTFKIIPEKEVAKAKQALGLSSEDRLGFMGNAIGLSRYLHADYMLYTSVRGEIKAPTINMQLLQVNSGELIWSGSHPVQAN